MTFVYDGAKRIQTRTDQQLDYVTMIYDMANRLMTREYRDSTKQPTDPPNDSDSFTYDGDGGMLTAVSGRYSNTLAFAYDQAGRLTSEALTIAGQTYIVGRAYDAANRLVTLAYPDGSVFVQSFTARNLLGQVNYHGALAASFTYDASGRRATRTLGDTPGTTTTWGYVPGGDLVASITTPNLPSFTYNYDSNENKTAETIGGLLQPYGFSTGAGGYDNHDRLIAWNRADNLRNQSWALTKVGDWQEFVDAGVANMRTHNAVHELTANGSSLLTYDLKGSLISNAITGATFAWDFDDQLQQAVEAGTTVTFGYDAFGRRVTKAAGGTSTMYVWLTDEDAGLGRVAAEYQGGSAPASPGRIYVHGGEADEPLMLASSAALYYYHLDASLNVRALSAIDGSIAEFYAYTAFGGTTILAANGITVLQASAVGNSIMYAGHRLDPETALYYVQARYYDAELGRFITRNPVDDADGVNAYSYANNMPFSASDPSGARASSALGGGRQMGGDVAVEPGPPIIDGPTVPVAPKPARPPVVKPTKPPVVRPPKPPVVRPPRPPIVRPPKPPVVRPTPRPIPIKPKIIPRPGPLPWLIPLLHNLIDPTEMGNAEIRRPPPSCADKKCNCFCMAVDGLGREHGPYQQGKMTERDCKWIPNTEYGKGLNYVRCFCK